LNNFSINATISYISLTVESDTDTHKTK
jgi:hypothetical protein